MGGKRVVAVSGGFDPLHVGHLRMIREASRLGDVVVIVNTDDFLVRKKGYALMPLVERVEVLKAIIWVSRVVVSVDEDDSVCRTLELIKPDIFANGGDRRSREDLREGEVCERLGIEMVFGVGGEKVQSSSSLAEGVKLRDG